MRAFFLLLLTAAHTASAQAPADSAAALSQSVVILDASPTAPSDAQTRAFLVAGGSLVSFTLGSAAGYATGHALDSDFSPDDFDLSDLGLTGAWVGGTLASGLAAHWLSPADDPLWRTLLVPLVAQGVYVLAIDQAVADGNQLPYLLGAPVIGVVSASVAASWE